MPCLQLIVVMVYIVLCSKVHTTTSDHERSRGLNDCWRKTAQHRSVELYKPDLDSSNFFYHLVMFTVAGQPRLLLSHVLSILKAWFPATEEWFCIDIRLIHRRRWIVEKCEQCLQLAGRRSGLKSYIHHFATAKKIDQKTALNSMTVHF